MTNEAGGGGDPQGGDDTEKKVKKGEGGNGKDGVYVPFHKLFAFADLLDVLLMTMGSFSAISHGLALPLSTLLFGELIDSFGQADRTNVVHVVSKVALKYVYLAVGGAVVAFLQITCWMITGERQATRIRRLYLSNILRQDIAFFDMEIKTGEVIGRMSGDTILIQEALGKKVGKFIEIISTFLGGLAIALIKGWLLALVTLASIPLIVTAGCVMSLIISRLSIREGAAHTGAGIVVEQAVGSIKTVVSFTGEKKAIAEYNKALRTAYLATVKQGVTRGAGVGAMLLLLFCSYALSLWCGSKLIINKGYTGGQVINVMLAIMNGGMSFGQASPCLNAIAAGRAAACKMFKTIGRKPEIDAYDKSGIVLGEIKGDIELKNIHFCYPARPEVAIFSGFSLHVPCGTTVAIVGESGSGKSTVVSLVERFYDPQAGEVLIDGVNLKKLQLSWIREKIGLVNQEPVLFATSIKENIAYGKTGATLEEIKTAIELSNAAKFIDNMPQGLETMVGAHGTQLSGGQKQRIAIARAILRNPRILLLDEATSALDVESEHVVQDALTRIMVERTTIVIAHRLSTIKSADSISVMHGGKIVEQGKNEPFSSHMELIRNPKGSYSQLIRSQQTNHGKQEGIIVVHKELSLESNKVSRASDSQQYSLNRSIRGQSSSLDQSNRHSLSISSGLPDTVHIHDGGLSLSDVDRGGHIPGKFDNNVSVWRLAYLNKPELPVLLLGCIAAAINGVIFPVFGFLFSIITNTFFKPPHQLQKDANFWSLMYLVLGATSFLVAPIQAYLFGVAGAQLIKRIRAMTFERVLHQEIGWFDEAQNSSGAICARLSADAATMRGLVGDALSLVVQNIITLIAGITIAFVANWQLSLIILVYVPLIGLEGFAQIKFLERFNADAKAMYEEASQVANDAISSIRTVASFCAEQQVMDLYEEKCGASRKNGIRQALISGLGCAFSLFVLSSVYALSFYVGARLVESGNATFGKVLRVFFALTLTAAGVSQTSGLAPDFSKAKVSAASIFSIIDRRSQIDPSDAGRIRLPYVKGNIEFQHVSFKYPTRPNMQIFTDLSLIIGSGKTVALVGESGSGKSTVLSLLERFYDADSGHILLDGMEIQKLQLTWLRQQIGLVTQEPVLFNGTIRANIAYGKTGAVTEMEITAAAQAANALEFILALPEGYDTIVGERGVQLSGGQKQRIAIARAIIKEPKILLLDEATSALDAESERVVQDALNKVMVNRTAIVVAHRLPTIQGADLIAVIKDGVIAEKGKHDELMSKKDGLYASLVTLHNTSC
ncbi:ABC transporter B family member 11 [Nymphaea thermarum]|nr:ABC transporter B family member 11 [Nymphaea thermarum]